jgi:hypothetical protein
MALRPNATKKLILAALCLGFIVPLTALLAEEAEPAAPRVIEAASCSQKDVQQAIDSAGDGDTVLLPEGEAVWKPPNDLTPSVIIKEKAITLQGAGVGRTVITDGSPTAWRSLALAIQGGGKPARVTGITFRKGTDARGANAINVSGCNGWRVDHCRFDYNGVGGALISYGDSFGLIDNCTIERAYTAVNIRGRGDESWMMPLALGTADAVYIEDCTFIDVGPDGPTDGYDGARYVFRHNTVRQTDATKPIGGIGHHGFDSGGLRSTFSCEVYGNTFSGNGWLFGRSRGGTGVIFDNTVTGQVGFYLLVYYRSSDKDEIRRLCSGWGPMCDGSNPLDGNEEPNGYPGRDQPGRSTDAGRTTPQLLEPVYEWNNTLNAEDADLQVQDLGGRSLEHIKEGRDFFNDTVRPGYKPHAYPHPLQREWPGPPPTDTAAPTVPAGLAAASLDERRVQLTWQPPTDDGGLAGYHVLLDGRKVTTITDPAFARYTFLRLVPPLDAYTFAVSAFDAAGNESEPCAAVKAAGGAG